MSIKVNKIKCLECGDVIESAHHYDFKVCSCWNSKKGKGCAVDGGRDYLRRCGSNYEELSEYDEDDLL
jgi:hypothetical protein